MYFKVMYFFQGSSKVLGDASAGKNKISTISGHLVVDSAAKIEVDLNESRDNLDSQSTKTEDTIDSEKVMHQT